MKHHWHKTPTSSLTGEIITLIRLRAIHLHYRTGSSSQWPPQIGDSSLVSLHGHITAKVTHQEWPCTLLLNCNSLPTLSMPFVVTEVHGIKLARINKGTIMPYCYFRLEHTKKRLTLKTVALFRDGTGSTRRWSVLSAKEKGIPHIIPSTWGDVIWGFLSNSVTVQSSHTGIVGFVAQHQAWATGGRHAATAKMVTSCQRLRQLIMSFLLVFSLSFFIVVHTQVCCMLNPQFCKVVVIMVTLCSYWIKVPKEMAANQSRIIRN